MRPADLEAIARRVVDETVAALPADVAAAAEGVATVFEPRPARHWLDDGVMPDDLGLFSGPSMRDPDASCGDEAPLVTLFLRNIADYSGWDAAAFEEEVERTWLHEFGHYLGLEERDMAPRDLD